jgi:hypothetical protein
VTHWRNEAGVGGGMEHNVGACCWVAWGTGMWSSMGQNAIGEMVVALGSFYRVGERRREEATD